MLMKWMMITGRIDNRAFGWIFEDYLQKMRVNFFLPNRYALLRLDFCRFSLVFWLQNINLTTAELLKEGAFFHNIGLYLARHQFLAEQGELL